METGREDLRKSTIEKRSNQEIKIDKGRIETGNKSKKEKGKNGKEPQGNSSKRTNTRTLLWNNLKALNKRDYIPGDTFRYIFQKTPEMHWTYIYYRSAITFAHGVNLIISLFNIFTSCPPDVRYTCLDGLVSLNIAWPFYLTSWGLMLNFGQSLLGLVLTVRAHLSAKKSKLEGAVPQFLKTTNEHSLLTLTGFYWCLNSASTVLAVTITLVYWSLVYNYSRPPTLNLLNSMAEHLLNMVWMTVDRCLVAFPVLLIHCSILLPIGLSYILSTFVYFAIGGLDQNDQKDYLYDILNWHSPGSAIFAMVILTIFTILMLLPLEQADRFKHKCRPKVVREAYANMLSSE